MTFDDFRAAIRAAVTQRGYPAVVLHAGATALHTMFSEDAELPVMSDDLLDLGALNLRWDEVPDLIKIPDAEGVAAVMMHNGQNLSVYVIIQRESGSFLVRCLRVATPSQTVGDYLCLLTLEFQTTKELGGFIDLQRTTKGYTSARLAESYFKTVLEASPGCMKP